MPGSILNADINFPHFTGQESTEQKIDTIQNYLFMLYEQLRYSMGNLGTENFSEGGIKDLEQIVAKKIDLTGYVTFSSLSEPGQTVINGANLMTGTVTADDVVANISIEAPTIRGGDIYGVTYRDENGNSKLDITSGGGVFQMSFGGPSHSGAQNGSFGIYHDAIDGADQMYLAGKEIARASWNSPYVMMFCESMNCNEVETEGSLRIYLPSGRYWEIDGSGMYYYESDGTYINNVQLDH